MSQKYQGIIFDMDGVLVNSEAFYYQRRKAFLKKYNLSFENIPLPTVIGADMRSLWKTILKINGTIYDEAFLEEQYIQYKRNHPINYQPLVEPDAKRVLQYLKRKGYKIGLASSSKMEVIQEVLGVAQLNSYFDVIVSGSQFKKSKPDPEIYEYTVKQLRLLPENCLAIEDSEKGIQSAYHAGITCWAMKDKQFGMNQELADDKLETLSEICKKLQHFECASSSEGLVTFVDIK